MNYTNKVSLNTIGPDHDENDEPMVVYTIMGQQDINAYEAAMHSSMHSVVPSMRRSALDNFLDVYAPHYELAMRYEELCEEAARLARDDLFLNKQ